MTIARHNIFVLICFTVLSVLIATPAQAAPKGQSFAGAGVGFEVLTNGGSGTGFYTTALGGYQFNDTNFGLGLHVGYSNVGGVGIKVLDFGAFAQYLDDVSGMYGRLYVDGIHGSTADGKRRNGVDGRETTAAVGTGLGLLIPSAGSFHLVPEVTYRLAFFKEQVHLIAGTFGVQWDF
ncbi:MAG TPA: hypothetical protein PLH57_05550 [Oligoflexia bacterium]|nr:hypothetical protein [Oligoflexia bacterium]